MRVKIVHRVFGVFRRRKKSCGIVEHRVLEDASHFEYGLLFIERCEKIHKRSNVLFQVQSIYANQDDIVQSYELKRRNAVYELEIEERSGLISVLRRHVQNKMLKELGIV